MPKTKSNTSGQMLISVLIAFAIFSILVHAIFTLVKTSYQFVSFNKARITARHLAQEKIELIRNLSYDDIGTMGGIPAGPLPQEENILRNKLNFLVKTDIIYVDDPFDGQSPIDPLGADYKRIRVDVSWEGIAKSGNNPIVLVSDIAPSESAGDGGTLAIFIFDADGEPVPQADVLIVANSIVPPINLTLQTPDNGRITLPGSPICTDCYEITVTKAGYSSERTYSVSEVANPNKPHQSILDGDRTEISFSIDKVSTLNLASVNDRESGFTPLVSVAFQMRGIKTLGTDTEGENVYKFDQSLTTNASGLLTISSIEWDNYQISMPEASGWDISGTNPMLPLVVLPDTTYDFTFALTPHTNHSLLVGFTDTSQATVASVSATLSDGLTFEETKLSGESGNPDFGQAFFSDLNVFDYTLEATASGFIDFSGEISVSDRTQEIVILTPE